MAEAWITTHAADAADGTRLESADALPQGPDNLIEELGHRFARGMELLQARMPAPEEGQLVALSPGVPVVRMLHIDHDPDGRTLQVADDLYASDRHEFAFEWTEPWIETNEGRARG